MINRSPITALSKVCTRNKHYVYNIYVLIPVALMKESQIGVLCQRNKDEEKDSRYTIQGIRYESASKGQGCLLGRTSPSKSCPALAIDCGGSKSPKDTHRHH